MIFRPVTAISVLGACAVGLGLYFVKYEVQDLKDDLSATNREIVNEREAIHVLNAEWSLLNDPARLRRLAQRYLGMEPVEPAQILPIDALQFKADPVEAAPAVKLVTQNEGMAE